MTLKNIVEICVAIDIAILGIAYPIIVDKISNIGDKYSSNYLSVLFNNEFPQNAIRFTLNKKTREISILKLTLFLCILTFTFLIFDSKPLFGWNNWFINNSAKLIVLSATSLLTIFFFIWLDKVVLYNGKSTSLLKHVINEYNSMKKDSTNRSYYLKVVNEFSYYAIDKQDEHLQETLLEFYYSEFSIIRNNHNKSVPLVYPSDWYLMIHKLIFQLANSQNKKLLAIEHRAVSGLWLLGDDYEEITISLETYNWLWRNLYDICEKEKYIKMYWSSAFQYFDFQLSPVDPDYSFENNAPKNILEITKREQERNTFLEFHYALGGLLLYRNQYTTLKYIFEYTQSLPPRFVLLPETMTTIFEWFEEFRNEFKTRSSPIDSKYYFPELDNLGNRRQVNYWICSYLSVLFIRQYTLNEHYTFQNFTALPNLPDNVIELNNWLDNVSYFERCLNEVLANKILLRELRYSEIVEEKNIDFKAFIHKLRAAIKEKIGFQKHNAPLSPEKIRAFEESTNKIISASFRQYEDIFVSDLNKENSDDLKLTVFGGRTLMPKSAFTEDDIPNLNYDSIFASLISKNSIKQNIPNSFFVARTRRYLLNRNNFIEGLDRIVNENRDAVIIGVNLGYDLKELMKKYSDILKEIPSTEYGVRDLFFILRKSDLPSIGFKEIDLKIEENSTLKLINDEIKLYTSVIDINKSDYISIKEKWSNEESKDTLDLKVQVSISFLAIISWKSKRDVIQLNLASQYKEQGIQNSLDEIEPLS